MRVILNGIEVEVDASNISWDFVSQNGNPNTLLLNDLVLKLYSIEFDRNGDGVQVVKNWLNSFGVLRPIPCQIYDDRLGLLFDGYGDLGSDKTRLSCDIVELHAVSDFENFFQRAEGFNIRSIRNTPFDVANRRVNYVLEEIPDYLSAAIATITLFMLVRDIVEYAKSLAQELTNAITAPINVALQIAYGLVLAVEYIVMLTSIINLLYQKPFAYYVANLRDVIANSCAAIGYTFESSILNEANFKKLFLLGDTDTRGAKFFGSGNPENEPIPDWTLSTLLDETAKLFDGRVKAELGGVVRLEEKEYFYNLPTSFTIAETNADAKVYFNARELKESIVLQFSDDPFDKQTRGRAHDRDDVAATLERAGFRFSTGEDSLLGEKSSARNPESEIVIGFARGARKARTTALEVVFNTIFDTVNVFLSLFGKSMPAGYTGSRVGYMLLENHGISQTKLLMLNDEGLIDTKQKDLLNAEILYNSYYSKNQLDGEWGKWTIVEGVAAQPICSDAVLASLRNNNVCYDFTGRIAVLESHIYDEETDLYTFKYRIQGWNSPIDNEWAAIPSQPVNTWSFSE